MLSEFALIGEQAALEVVEARSTEKSNLDKACSLMRGALHKQADIKVPELTQRPIVAEFMEQHDISLATLRQAATKVRNEIKANAPPSEELQSQTKGRRRSSRASGTAVEAVQSHVAGISNFVATDAATLPLSDRPEDRRAHHSAEGM